MRNRLTLARPLRLLATLVGLVVVATVVTTMALLHKSTLPEFGPLAWLIPLAIYDLQKREVPHIVFVAVPGGLAVLAAGLHGHWTLAAIAILVVFASERHHSPKPFKTVALVAACIGCAVLLGLTPFEQSPGAIAIIGFWFAYELGWWAGADALAAMTLALTWPDVRLLVSVAASHLVTAIFLNTGRVSIFPRRLAPEELEHVGVAGLPALALSAAMFVIWQWWSA